MDWTELFINLLCVVGTCVIPIICNSVVKFIKIKTNNNTILSAIEAVDTAVVATSQTFVETLKKNGNFTVESQIEAKNNAIAIAKTLIADNTKKIIESAYGDFNTWLDATIEKLVNENK